MHTTAEVEIQVTAEDITRGVRNDWNACPIARAIERATGRRVAVIGRLAYLSGTDDFRLRFDLPLSAQQQQFIRQFDAGEVVQPFTFTLSVPVTE